MNNNKEDLSFHVGHRTRLRQKFLAGQLGEVEILELLLTYAIPRCDVRILSRQLYKKYGGIHNLLSMPIEALVKNNGVKENTAILFKIIHYLTKLEYKVTLDSAPIFYNQTKLENYCKLLVGNKPIEEFHVLYLDAQFKLIEDQLHSSGTVDCTAVYIREIIKKALDLNTRNIVLLHNHPTPNTLFSTQDIKITTALENSCIPLGIQLYDHFLVSGDVVYSARNMHFLDSKLETLK